MDISTIETFSVQQTLDIIIDYIDDMMDMKSDISDIMFDDVYWLNPD